MLTRRTVLSTFLSAGALSSIPLSARAATAFPMKSFLDDLDEIVRIDSKTGFAEGVDRVGDVFEKRFKSIGWTVTRPDAGDFGHAVLATNFKDQSKFDVLLCGHLDTAQPQGNAAKYPLKVVGTQAHGAGVADDKASITAIWWICRDLPQSILKKLRIAVLLVPGEEVGGGDHDKAVIEYGGRAKYALVYEPGRPGGHFVRVRKGCTWLTVDFQGVAAHAGNNPQDGRNAIDALSLAVPKINAVAAGFDGLTISTGVVKGGTVPNTVAAQASVTFDMRYLRDSDRDAALAQIEKLCKAGFAPGVTATVSYPYKGPAMAETEASQNLRRIIQDAAKDLGQPQGDWLIVGGSSDGNVLSGAGVAVVDAMGVCGGNLHNPEKEYIDLATVEPRIALGRKTLELLAKTL
ncbi:MAG: M20/M25/M40 family metallo-hydrolase [Sutterellaceae bacterium]|nr:M20/M25/M40 family metallo-hydrolase [Sutterellaceae bacterium]